MNRPPTSQQMAVRIVLDEHGDTIGIGRRGRVVPDWLREAIATMFPTSIGPGSKASARHCDLDHHHEWDRDDGPTDLDNLAPVDRRFHTAKTNGEWNIRPGPNGTRVISHPKSGWKQNHHPRHPPYPTPRHHRPTRLSHSLSSQHDNRTPNQPRDPPRHRGLRCV